VLQKVGKATTDKVSLETTAENCTSQVSVERGVG